MANGEIPKQIKQVDLFRYIESELKAIDGTMSAPKSNEYGRADQAALWSLLARLYLNAEVYSGDGHDKNAEYKIDSKLENEGSPDANFKFVGT
ncbi:RagB/SusD family nutrient uptake outer membrane protein [Flavobacterium cellulosilyticum]|uniref:Uncharacterized protein n=1 Tax=Flavobacterium cellulosilyticum TaxID=2541731 RepID=A0A4R5C4R6_9FLAO|nr:hypothetical protein [Flavobacterium cellulosilyticum]TDD94701.1 hypothetical protein E0F76_15805 [Flavobacterium cellulosilyticum]